MSTWYVNPRWSARLVAEKAIMSDRFPQMTLYQDNGHRLFWSGWLTPVPGSEFSVKILYPDNYPYREPEVRVIEPEIRAGAPHVYVDGRICIHRVRWNPEAHTAPSLVPLISAWLVAYLDWQATGENY